MKQSLLDGTGRGNQTALILLRDQSKDHRKGRDAWDQSGKSWGDLRALVMLVMVPYFEFFIPKLKKKSFFSVIFMIELFLFNKLAGPFDKENYVKRNRDLQNSSPSYFKSSGVCWKQWQRYCCEESCDLTRQGSIYPVDTHRMAQPHLYEDRIIRLSR